MKAKAATTIEEASHPPKVRIETERVSFWAKNRSRVIKSTLGALALGYGFYHAYAAFFVYESSTAAVTSTISTLSAPINGIVHHSLGGPGLRLEANSEVATIKNPRVDRTHVARLRAQLIALDGDIATLHEQRDGYATLGTKFESRGRQYLEQRREQLTLEVSQAVASVEAARVQVAATSAELARQAAMRKEGIASAQAFEAATSAHADAERALLVAEKQKESKVAALQGTHAGFNLDSSSPTDRTYSGQRADEVTLRIAELNALSSEKLVERSAVQAELDEALIQLSQLSETVLKAPGARRLWEILAPDGEFVYAGRPLLNWLECDKVHVVAYVSGDVFERLTLGTQARIRFPHGEGEHEGVVSLLPGQNEHSERSKQALSGKGTVTTGYAVLITSKSLAGSLSKECAIGQSVEVRFFP